MFSTAYASPAVPGLQVPTLQQPGASVPGASIQPPSPGSGGPSLAGWTGLGLAQGSSSGGLVISPAVPAPVDYTSQASGSWPLTRVKSTQSTGSAGSAPIPNLQPQAAPLPNLLRGGSAGSLGLPMKPLIPQQQQQMQMQPSSPSAPMDIPVGSDVAAAGTSVADPSQSIYERIDADRDGSISMLELLAAVQKDPVVADFILPGMDNSRVLDDEDAFDTIDEIFSTISGGKTRITRAEFSAYFNQENNDGLRALFHKIDKDHSGTISKLELLAAVKEDQAVAALVRPCAGENGGESVLSDQDIFDTVGHIFDAMSAGKRRADFGDFKSYLRKRPVTRSRSRKLDGDAVRCHSRLLLIGPGCEFNPQLGTQITQAGYQLRCVSNLPDPELLGPQISNYLGQLKAAIDDFEPHVLLCASKGGLYVFALWQSSIWQGPTVMINAHPLLTCLPGGARVVLAHGSEDEMYRRSRTDLESLIATGSPNSCFLYYAGSSGLLNGIQRSRLGDSHCMASLLSYDCLPRLIDAAMSEDCPETYMLRSWQGRMSDQRLEAERWLGHSLDKVKQHWESKDRQGLDKQKVFAVSPGSDEFRCVATIFKAAPREAPAYGGGDQSAWERAGILSIERVENGAQERGGARAYEESMQRSLEDQGITFEPGVHTRWAFHGTDAIESIVQNPMSGFQPLASGSRGASLWGSGTYFARDAKYVADGQFCGRPGPDGSRRMLMCLLSTGMPCFGNPDHHGVLPFRQGAHRYDSTVDSLSSPEVFILQNPGAAYPAYIISFA